MRHPAQTRADAVVDGELPALLSRLTVAVHVVVDFGTLVKRASAALELGSVPQPLPAAAGSRIHRRADVGLSGAKLGMRISLTSGTTLCRAVGCSA
jgi:hypothetical protein